MQKWIDAYPAVDVPGAIKRFAAWCQANPKQRKTRMGVERAINTWLAKDQNNASRPPPASRFNDDKPVKQQSRGMSPDEVRHCWAADRIMEGKLNGLPVEMSGDFRFNLWDLCDEIIEKVRKFRAHCPERTIRSACFGEVHAAVRQRF